MPAGSVISQNPVAGTQVASGSAVNLVVSTGPPPVAVPNVVNLTQAAATSAITGAGLMVGTVTNSVERDGAGRFGDQPESAAGTQVASGSAVNLVVSTGPPPVSVPNVVEPDAGGGDERDHGRGPDRRHGHERASATVPAGSVISQNPIAGTQVAPGSAVNLVVSTGPPPVAVPNVVNLTQAAATSAITGASLIVGTVDNASSATVPAGSVISQNPDRRNAGRRPAARSISSSRPARRRCRCPTSST